MPHPSYITSLKTEGSQPHLLYYGTSTYNLLSYQDFVSEPMKGKNCLIKGSIPCNDLFLKGLLPSDTSKKSLNTQIGVGRKVLFKQSSGLPSAQPKSLHLFNRLLPNFFFFFFAGGEASSYCSQNLQLGLHSNSRFHFFPFCKKIFLTTLIKSKGIINVLVCDFGSSFCL